MSLRPRFLSTLVVLLAFAGVTSQVASCGLETQGTQDPASTTPCTSDANCEDGNPCTVDTCQADNTCLRTNAENGPLMQQIAGDCLRDDCIEGEVVSTNDDADVADDNEQCTTDGCKMGSPTHTPVPDDTMCTLGVSPGKCAMGVCTVECSPTKPCDDMNPCTEDSCNAGLGTCTFIPLDGLPTPGFMEPVGDCRIHICANGVDAPLNDDADTKDDMNSCTFDVCMNGVESHPGVSIGTPCMVGQPDVCNGQGTCVKCNVPADCVNLPANDDCQTRTCINNVCGQDFTVTGTPISNQKAGDCKQVVCDGTGKTMVVNLDTDLPEDNNPCTQNVCTAGAPSNPNITAGVSCGNPLICDGMGNCIGCLTPADCINLPPNDFCKTRTCINQVCGLSLTPAGTDTPTGQTAQNCKVFECDAMGNIVESVDPNDKPVDNNQCTKDVCSVQGDPSNPPEPVNTACMQTGGTVCNGAGACKIDNGDTCAMAGDCLSGFCVDGVCCDAACGNSCKSCNVPGNLGKCTDVPKGIEDLPGCTGTNSCDGAGTCKKDDAQGCGAASECVSNFCIDGVCCAAACTGACRACNLMGTVGICSPLTSGEDNVPANVCNGNKGCDMSGACKLDNGQTCAMGSECVSGQCFDGVCCNVACSGTCKACNITGAVGTCSNVATGLDDANGVPACTGANQSCDGMGTCKKENGQTCSATSECLSGFCVDGVCCNAACTGTCVSCNLGTPGTCANVATGQDDMGTCSGNNQSCDGSGACKTEVGFVCSTNANCLGGFCVDGFCCNTACTGTCQACSNVTKGQGADGTCGPIITGTDPDNECAMGSCNGSSTCKLDLGVTCTMDAQCLSGNCVDGVCCNSACGGTTSGDCQACSMAAGASANGTCTTLSAGTVCRAKNGVCDVAETCNGSATTCPMDAVEPNTTVCRPDAMGGCDVAENCNGTLKTCPTDAFKTNGTVCRASAGVCDTAETCSGMNGMCPTDAFQSAATVCRAASTNGCDVAEHCPGNAAACPADGFSPMGTVCRAATMGGCDVAETCSGMSDTCPNDGFQANGTVCRAAAGVCDQAETCTGSSANCPANTFKPSSTECRAAADVCDQAEDCTGSSAACPTDVFKPDTTVCRAQSGGCDIAETCTGMGAACPPNDVEMMGTTCRAATTGGCDVAEVCDGTSNACPADGFRTAGFACRPAVAGGCDIGEVCSGSSANCPTDAVQPAGTVCRAADDVCDLDETCNGTANTCPLDVFKTNSVVCRPAAGGCDVDEKCTGSAAACPADMLTSAGTTCRSAVPGGCDIAETCSGASSMCPTDVVATAGTTCRAAVAGGCDIAETCNGTANTCPNDAVQPNGTTCRAAVAGGCDIAETCNGTANTCPNDAVQPNGTTCRAAVAGGCDIVETCNGTANTCPNDAVQPNGTTCRAAVGACDIAETCNGSANTCPSNAFRPSGTACGDAQSCTGTTQTNADECDGMGACTDNGTTPCGNYTCNTTACFTTCTTNAECSGTNTCTGNICGP